MTKPNLIVDKSFEFAVLIIKHLGSIKKSNQADIFSKQLLKSATSVGANIREAHNAKSKNDFIHKMGIAQKECDETRYWWNYSIRLSISARKNSIFYITGQRNF